MRLKDIEELAKHRSTHTFQYYVYLLQSGVIKKPLEICKTDINLKKNLKELV